MRKATLSFLTHGEAVVGRPGLLAQSKAVSMRSCLAAPQSGLGSTATIHRIQQGPLAPQLNRARLWARQGIAAAHQAGLGALDG